MLCVGLACTGPVGAVTPMPNRTAAYADAMRSVNPHLARTQSLAYAVALLRSAKQVHVDPALVMAIVTVESGWHARAVSIHGAQGLGQLKPETARGLGVNPWSATANLRGVAKYLHRLLAFFAPSRHAMIRAIAGYNAGPYAVVNAGGRVPDNGQTPRYVGKVIAALHRFHVRLGRRPSAAAVATALDAMQTVQQRETAYWGEPDSGPSAAR